jgi:hypothetical protein
LNKFKSAGKEGIFVFILGVIYAILSQNTFLTISALVIPFILMKLVWRKGDSPILFIAVFIQWIAISVKVFYANYIGEDFIEVHSYPQEIITSFYLCLIGLVSLSFGINLALRNHSIQEKNNFQLRKGDYNYTRLTQVYMICSIVYPILFALSFTLGGLQQPLSKLLEFKWAIFFIFMLYSFQTGQYKIFSLIACYEIILSFTGYFSGFKDYFFALFIGLIIVFGKKIKPKHIFPMLMIITVGIYCLMIWQYVKPEYRNFLSAGVEAQVSVRSTEESLNKLLELVSEAGPDAISDGFENTVNRLSYIDFLSASITQVPANIPHTNGELWSGAFSRILQPRLLFPDKKVIDDSEKASLYTGTEFYGASRGVSVSLGYFAESYVDFGMFGMHIILFIFGFIIGSIYKYVLHSSSDIIIGTALVFPMFFVIYNFETALDKIVGALFMYFVIYLLVRRFALKPLLLYIKN